MLDSKEVFLKDEFIKIVNENLDRMAHLEAKNKHDQSNEMS